MDILTVIFLVGGVFILGMFYMAEREVTRLKKENGTLRANEEALTSENGRLRNENTCLHTGERQLATEVTRLKEEIDQLRAKEVQAIEPPAPAMEPPSPVSPEADTPRTRTISRRQAAEQKFLSSHSCITVTRYGMVSLKERDNEVVMTLSPEIAIGSKEYQSLVRALELRLLNVEMCDQDPDGYKTLVIYTTEPGRRTNVARIEKALT